MHGLAELEPTRSGESGLLDQQIGLEGEALLLVEVFQRITGNVFNRIKQRGVKLMHAQAAGDIAVAVEADGEAKGLTAARRNHGH